jgi:hypothetical protein
MRKLSEYQSQTRDLSLLPRMLLSKQIKHHPLLPSSPKDHPERWISAGREKGRVQKEKRERTKAYIVKCDSTQTLSFAFLPPANFHASGGFLCTSSASVTVEKIWRRRMRKNDTFTYIIIKKFLWKQKKRPTSL